MWVRIRTAGRVTYDVNPAAEGKPCQSPCLDHVAPMGPSGSAGGAGIPGTGYLRVSVAVGPPGTAHVWRPIEFGDGQLESIVRVSPGWELQAGRMGIQGILSCIFCTTPVPPTPWYLLGGQTVITAQKVIPLQAAARQLVVARGNPVQFDAVAIEHVSEFEWFYIATDGAPRLEARVDECTGKSFCTYAPRENGHMLVFGRYPNGTVFRAQTDPVRVVDAELSLECTPSTVERRGGCDVHGVRGRCAGLRGNRLEIHLCRWPPHHHAGGSGAGEPQDVGGVDGHERHRHGQRARGRGAG
jgi:hypothetical protein